MAFTFYPRALRERDAYSGGVSPGLQTSIYQSMIMETHLTMTITVYGKVQGVGFRPLVCRLAKKCCVTGFVKNAGTHVEIVATGTQEAIASLCESLKSAALPVRVDTLVCSEISEFDKRKKMEEAGIAETFASFASVMSSEAEEVKFVSADIGICPCCLQEVKEKGNRRNSYSYISCAQCGPRYTIIKKLPYDRANTTMESFALCDECAGEYNNMTDRRGHGETISCFRCGPQLKCFIKNESAAQASDEKIIGLANDLLKKNQIVMVKAVGGFNLVCRADRTDVVARLRDLKKRVSKPFAVMVKNTEEAARFCYVSFEEKQLLESEARPIVLLQKKRDGASLSAQTAVKKLAETSEKMAAEMPVQISLPMSAQNLRHDAGRTQPNHTGAVPVAENVTDVSDQIGVMLPSMGFYACLDVPFPVIVTSCNYAGEPILYKDEEAFRFYEAHEAIAALFTYDREILRPADDSVTRIVKGRLQILRRTKGYMPEPLCVCSMEGAFKNSNASEKFQPGDRHNDTLLLQSKSVMRQKCNPFVPAHVHYHYAQPVLATGAEMKPGFCLAAGGSFFPAEIPGDLALEATEAFFEETVKDWMQLLSVRPEAVVADLHEGYTTTAWGKQFAEKNCLPFYQVQHHHAHALSVMAEHGLTGKTLAVCFDGTGAGTDGTVWGGEFLVCEGAAYKRVGHIKAISMLGGDGSMQQAWKTALCHLAAAEIASPDPRFAVVKAALQHKINCIETTSMGRLFDAAASILGLADFNSHQGRCAMALETAARNALQNKIQPLALAFSIEEERDENRNNKYNASVYAVSNDKSNLNKVVYNPAPLWNCLCKSCGNEELVCAAALGFHYALVNMVVDMAERVNIKQIALCGGCFANRILLENCTTALQTRGFQVYYNEAVSPGDGGIAVGQAYYGQIIYPMRRLNS